MWWSQSLVFICVFAYAHAQHGYSDGHGSYATSYSSSNIQRGGASPSYGYASSPVVAKIAAPVIAKVATPVVAKYVAPAAVYSKAPIHEDYYAPPKYEFHYEVADSHTGDKKSQHEIRDGDVTKGEYSFVEADGTVRTVHYSVDGHSGFNAIVERSGHASHPQASPVKAVVAAPVIAAASHDYYKY